MALWALIRVTRLEGDDRLIAARVYVGPALLASIFVFLFVLRVLRPIVRWERGADGSEEALRAANRTVRRAPMVWSAVTVVSWFLAFTPSALILVYFTPEIRLPAGTLTASLLVQAAILLGGGLLAYLHMMHALAPVTERISLEVRRRALRVATYRASTWRRNATFAIVLALVPTLSLFALNITQTSRAAEEIARLHAALGLPVTPVEDTLIQIFGRVAYVFVALMVFALLAATYLSKNMLTVVERVAAALRDIAQSGRVAGPGRIPLLSRGELGILVESANAMIDRLEEAQAESAAAASSLREANTLLEERVAERTESLREANRALEDHVQRLRQARSQLADAARRAGMAEVASSVLHNVGNVLNSVNVSASLIAGRLRGSKLPLLERSLAMVPEDEAEALEYVARHPRGRLVPAYVRRVTATLAAERDAMLRELELLEKNVDHIKVIVSLQQEHARQGGLLERLRPAELVDDAVRFGLEGELPPGVRLERSLDASLEVVSDRHRLFQILCNLLRNARDAVGPAGTIRVTVRADGERVLLEVADDGCGIAAENLTRIFGLGFTTKPDGHGYGLHGAANAARELGGELAVASDGVGRGATFTLRLPANATIADAPGRRDCASA